MAQEIAAVLHTDLAGARLVALWLLEARAEIEAPPLTDAQVDALLARRRGRDGVWEPENPTGQARCPDHWEAAADNDQAGTMRPRGYPGRCSP